IVESSPKRWHVYYRVTGMPLNEFPAAQRKLIKRLNSDENITDLPRVLRLPGFPHQKGKPFKVKVRAVWKGKPYKAEKFISHEVEPKPEPQRVSNLPPPTIDEAQAALRVLPSDSYDDWYKVGGILYKEFGDEKGLPLFETWSRKSEKYDERKCKE